MTRPMRSTLMVLALLAAGPVTAQTAPQAGAGQTPDAFVAASPERCRGEERRLAAAMRGVAERARSAGFASTDLTSIIRRAGEQPELARLIRCLRGAE